MRLHYCRDLFPYSCTFEDCKTKHTLYNTRKAWFNHEIDAHRVTWKCQICVAVLPSQEALSNHASNNHSNMSESSNMDIKVRDESLAKNVKCCLCNKTLTISALKDHLGNHQLSIALLALPDSVHCT